MTASSHHAGADPAFGLRTLDDLPEFAPDPERLQRHTLTGLSGIDPRGRPFNLMRTQFSKHLTSAKTSIVAITSAAPDAGKSFVSINLAAALSRVAEQRIILVDLDFRRGSIAAELGMSPQMGISDLLRGSTDDLASVGWKIKDSRLSVFPTCIISENSAELLSGERFATMINAFRNISENAIVICDTPPIYANDDTMIATRKMDGYILVVDSGHTTRRQVTDTIDLLKPIACMGAVLNRYKGGILEKYEYGYGYGSGAYDIYN